MERQANVTDVSAEHLSRRSHRDETVVRRRRSRRPQPSSRRWVAARSRRRMLRTAALSTGVLLLMALGLYFGLSRQDNASPVGGSERGEVSGPRGLV